MNGTVNLRFSLWDAAGTGSPPAGGNQVGSAQQITNVPISNGLFTVTLNGSGQFGSMAFNGQDNGAPLLDGPTATGSIITGSHEPTLRISADCSLFLPVLPLRFREPQLLKTLT